MTARALMFMGTGSDVGKSLIVAGLCRVLANRGVTVAPFKPQNMSNNAAATPDGGEIGRAQALQAKAAKIPPSIHLNPILLKPESDRGAQVIIKGKRHATLQAREFFATRHQFMTPVLDSFRHLAAKSDVILVEGAGSPAETNLRNGDLANMGFADAANLPVVLIGDIHRGGVIASLVGTHRVLQHADRSRIKSFLINNFHGDPELFNEGKQEIERRTGWPCHGVVPHFAAASMLPAEDALALEHRLETGSGPLKICVFRLPRIANFDDLDPLRLESGADVAFVQPGAALPGDCKLAILPGSKSTMTDLAAFRAQGWDTDLKAHVRRGGRVLGLCGGYQMLGKAIHDPLGLEGGPSHMEGLGLLDVETTLTPHKTTRPIHATHAISSTAINAYEIHLGHTTGPDCARPFAILETGLADGATSANGHIMGTYLHGCFVNDAFRAAFLKSLGLSDTRLAYDHQIEAVLDNLAQHLGQHIDIDALFKLAEPIT